MFDFCVRIKVQTVMCDDIYIYIYNGQALFPDGDGIFLDDNAPILTAHVVKIWYEEHESELEYIEWPLQSPDHYIIETRGATRGAKWRDKLETVTLHRRV